MPFTLKKFENNPHFWRLGIATSSIDIDLILNDSELNALRDSLEEAGF